MSIGLNNMKLSDWEPQFETKISEIASSDDPAHDLLHFKRVVDLSKYLCEREDGKPKLSSLRHGFMTSS
jgi:HD superfamily phosphodiesterase